MNKRYIGYIRVSSLVSRDKGNSKLNQINRIESYCNNNEYELIDLLIDDGISGWNIGNRNGVKKLIELVKDKSVDGIIVYSLSRLGRKMKDVVYIMDLLNKNNIEFISLKENINNNDIIGRLMGNILMSFNEFEVENIRERIKDVKRNNKENGADRDWETIHI